MGTDVRSDALNFAIAGLDAAAMDLDREYLLKSRVKKYLSSNFHIDSSSSHGTTFD
jgi:hypothetical protein